MKKIGKRLLFCAVLAASLWTGTLLADRRRLNEELIRLHVVANSDSREDQSIKLQVRNAVLQSLQADLSKISDVKAAKAYLQENLPLIRDTANAVLKEAGFDGQAVVSLCRESFDTRYYDTFTLPAGVYESLRIVIGAGEGRNWWCVAFPALCIPATSQAFSETAVAAGFPETLSETLAGEEGYEIRFLLLEILGKMENIFFQES